MKNGSNGSNGVIANGRDVSPPPQVSGHDLAVLLRLLQQTEAALRAVVDWGGRRTFFRRSAVYTEWGAGGSTACCSTLFEGARPNFMDL